MPLRIDDIIQTFNKKFSKVAEKMPCQVDFIPYTGHAEIRVDALPAFKMEWDSIIRDVHSNNKTIEEAVKKFIYDIKYKLAEEGFFPTIEYKRWGKRQLTPDEAISTLLSKQTEEIEDEDMYRDDLLDRKTFIITETDIRRGVVTLLDEEGKFHKFKHPVVSVIKLKALNKDVTPEELGRVFFKKAKPLKRGIHSG